MLQKLLTLEIDYLLSIAENLTKAGQSIMERTEKKEIRWLGVYLE